MTDATSESEAARAEWPALLWVAALALVLVVLVAATTPLTTHCGGFDWDGIRYGKMAGEIRFMAERAHEAPYCWRILTPFQATLLPFSILTNFWLIACVSSWVTLVLVYAMLRKTGFSSAWAVVGMLLYAGTFWTLKFSLYSPAYIDHQTQLFLVAGLYLIVSDRPWWVVAFLMLGVLQKESLLGLVPVAYVSMARQRGWFSRQAMAYLAAVLLAPALVLGVLHRLIPPLNDYSSPRVMLEFLKGALPPSFWPRFAAAAFSGLGLLIAIPFAHPRAVFRALKAKPEWIALLAVGAAFLFGGGDKARLFLYMLPAVLVCALTALQAIAQEGTPTPAAAAWLTVTLLLHAYLGNYLTPIGERLTYLCRHVPEHSPAGMYVVPFVWAGALSTLWWVGTRAMVLAIQMRNIKAAP